MCPTALTLSSFEIPVRGRRRPFPHRKLIGVHAQAHRAARLPPLRSRGSENLTEKTVTAGTLVVRFAIDDYTRWRLLEGLDDIGLTLRQVDAIAEYERSRPSWKPATLPARIEEPSDG